MSTQKSTHNLGRQNFGSEADRGKVPSEEWARALLTEWVQNPRLRLHCEQVGAVMAAWAEEKGLGAEEVQKWRVAGILHDADWDQWPDEHCRRIIEYLEKEHVDPDILHAIASHSPAFFGVEPLKPMDKMLYAFDELSGFIHAVSLVRPDGYGGMKAKSVKKKLKDKGFAAQVNRTDIEDSLSRIDVELDEIISFIIAHQAEL